MPDFSLRLQLIHQHVEDQEGISQICRSCKLNHGFCLCLQTSTLKLRSWRSAQRCSAADQCRKQKLLTSRHTSAGHHLSCWEGLMLRASFLTSRKWKQLNLTQRVRRNTQVLDSRACKHMINLWMEEEKSQLSLCEPTWEGEFTHQPSRSLSFLKTVMNLFMHL